VVEVLIQNGAKLDACTDSGASALHVACQVPPVCCVYCLATSNTGPSTDIYPRRFYILQEGQLEIAKLLIKNGLDVNKPTVSGMAKMPILPRFICNLIEHSSCRFGDIGATALMLSSKRGHMKLVRLLLDNNANVLAEMVSWKTRAWTVGSGKITAQPSSLILFHTLTHYGAQDIGQGVGASALVIAREEHHQSVVQMLLDHALAMEEARTPKKRRSWICGGSRRI
jgi:ankyrin repeat protein